MRNPLFELPNFTFVRIKNFTCLELQEPVKRSLIGIKLGRTVEATGFNFNSFIAVDVSFNSNFPTNLVCIREKDKYTLMSVSQKEADKLLPLYYDLGFPKQEEKYHLYSGPVFNFKP